MCKNMDINEIFKMMQKSGTVGKDFTSHDIQQFVQQMMSHVGTTSANGGAGSTGPGTAADYDTNKIYSFINNANNYNNQNRAESGGSSSTTPNNLNIDGCDDNDEEDFVDDDCGDEEGDEYGI
jgi:hypothetical protein